MTAPGQRLETEMSTECLELVEVGVELGEAGGGDVEALTRPAERFQSGVVNDYVTWLVIGLACVGGALAFAVG